MRATAAAPTGASPAEVSVFRKSSVRRPAMGRGNMARLERGSETALAAAGPGGPSGAMPVSPAYRPDPRFAALGPEFADEVSPARFPKEILRFRNQRAAASVGLDTLTEAEWLAHFARVEPLPGNLSTPLALRSHGPHFPVDNPHLR